MRVLHVIPDIGVANGVMSVILNYAKAMPPDITFDVAYFAEKPQTRQAEVEALGGKVYRLDAPCPQDLCNGKMGRFFAEHAGFSFFFISFFFSSCRIIAVRVFFEKSGFGCRRAVFRKKQKRKKRRERHGTLRFQYPVHLTYALCGDG